MNKLNRPSILVADPNPLSLTAISAMLHGNDYNVHIAQDTHAATIGAESLDLDLIICDDQIDEQGGLELIRKIRNFPQCIDTPIMFMTSNQSPDVISRSHEGSACYYLRKPIDPKLLLELVDNALWQLPIINDRVKTRSVKTPHFPSLPSSGFVNLTADTIS